MKKIFIVTIVIFSITLFAYIMFNKSTSDLNTSPKIKLGYIPIADCAQLYIAQENGFFKEEGLDIELIKFSGGAKILEALAGNSIDIGFSNVVSLILARNAGLDFQVIASGVTFDKTHQASGLMVLNESNINTLQDLEGKTIAINTKKNIVELFIIEYLKKNNVNTKLINFVEIPFPQMLQVLESKQVDAIATVEPFVSFGQQNKDKKVLGHFFSETMDGVEVANYDASYTWINKNLNTVKSFRRALNKASEFSKSHPKELRASIVKYTKLEEKNAKLVKLPAYNSSINKRSLSEVNKMVYTIGWIDNLINVDDIIFDN